MNEVYMNKIGTIMVVGGGIGGMQAALDAAEAGYHVYLVEKSSSIGGRMAQLDKTFPTNDCATCMVAPRLVECGRHLNIDIITLADVKAVSGEAGNFTVKILQHPRYVDMDKCIACGTCATKCPKRVSDAFNQGLSTRKAAYIQFPQAVPLKYAIDPKHCIYIKKGRCRACEKFCPTDAIDFSQTEKEIDLNVGAIILAPGFDTFDAERKGEYGYRRYPNVITSLDYERILAASGPYAGHIVRPLDGKEPEKIAWIQCVGSRDPSIGCNYCSYVCCMYATKQAIITKEHVRSIETTIFFMDIRAQGKGFDRYYESAKSNYNVRYVRSMISRIAEIPSSKKLLATYMEEDGHKVEEEFDMVVLSVGLRPNQTSREVARVMGIDLNEYGFSQHPPFDLVATSRPGIYVSGVFAGPKDIPETVMQSSAAAASATGLLAPVRGTMVTEKTYPPERDVSGEEPRIGVFVCHCGTNIGGVVDVKSVAEYAKTLPFVQHAEDFLFTCSTDTQKKMKEVIQEQGLNRVIVASCSPRTHESLFRSTLQESGLNKYLFEMANIRDQCSWVHTNEPEKATDKAKDLVRGVVARTAVLEPLHEIPFRPSQRALIIGGGVAGMTAALNLAEQGFETVLIEKENALGGHARSVYFTLNGAEVQPLLSELIRQVENHKKITMLKNAQLIDHSGFVGNFTTKVSLGDTEQEIRHGITIVASGGVEYQPREYLYGQHPAVLTQGVFHEMLAVHPEKFISTKEVVMIQCIGSRNPEYPYCSRICCQAAVMNALKLKTLNPDVNIYILYRDMRTFGFSEKYYQQAREKGMQFIRYDLDKKPEAISGERLTVRSLDPSLGATIELHPDFLILSAAIRPHPGSKQIASICRLPEDVDGFFMEAHVKLRPLDFATSGVFLCGLAHGPKDIEESITEAKGAAARAATILSKKEMMVGGPVATVIPELCAACLTCVRTCPFNVPIMNEEEGVVEIDPAACQGCGNCASACPRKAITVGHYKDDQMVALITAISTAHGT